MQIQNGLGQSITTVLVNHINSHMTGGRYSEHWPDDAVYCVDYSIKAWPTDYSHHTAFFADAYELTRWYDAKRDWTKYEDNYFELNALYMWDLGPQLVQDVTPHLNAR